MSYYVLLSQLYMSDNSVDYFTGFTIGTVFFSKETLTIKDQSKEKLKIKEHYAYSSLNANIDSFKLNLW